MANGGFASTAALLEKQAHRLTRQAQQRAELKAAALEAARIAHAAQAEARQANSKAQPSPSKDAAASDEEAATAAALKAMQVAGVATEASDNAAARASAATAKGENWMGADSLAILLGGLVDCRLDVHAATAPLQVVLRTCRAVMLQVNMLSEEELKKENQEVCPGLCVGYGHAYAHGYG